MSDFVNKLAVSLQCRGVIRLKIPQLLKRGQRLNKFPAEFPEGPTIDDFRNANHSTEIVSIPGLNSQKNLGFICCFPENVEDVGKLKVGTHGGD